jgi:cellobiose-specific phosphotransferase system component IIB
MFVYICCSGGMSSSLFCSRMVTALNETYPALKVKAAHLDTVMARESTYRDKYDLILVYGGVEFIRPENAFDLNQLIDVILIAPQVAYLLPLKQAILKDYPIIIKLIDKKIFGTMAGVQAASDLLDELVTLDMARSYLSASLIETKNVDKNIELLLMGVDRKGDFAKQLIQSFEAMGLRVVQEKYGLDTLYRFQPKVDYEIRLLFAYSHMLAAEDMAKLSRRIDGLIYLDSPLENPKINWFQDYQIPMLKLNRQVNHGRAVDLSASQDFLLTVAQGSEASSETYLAKFEAAPPEKRRHHFLGILSWES